jgi:NAD(P)-dependent dehydrogenase (short-subunit alcohol dehydrogenase family)
MTSETDRVAIVTGAAGGLGSNVATLFANLGINVALVDIKEDALLNVISDIGNVPSNLIALPADLSDVSQCEKVVANTISQLGRVDILVNAAAIFERHELEDMTPDLFDRTFHINARAPFFLTRASMLDMAKRKWGRVVNITSVGVYRGGMRMTSAPYEASKGAISVFTKMYANHGALDGILVNTVCPGMMATPMLLETTSKEILDEIALDTPLKRMADPIEVARMIVWICSDENTYSTGATFDINGGWVMP